MLEDGDVLFTLLSCTNLILFLITNFFFLLFLIFGFLITLLCIM